jgi:hypothetical protein
MELATGWLEPKFIGCLLHIHAGVQIITGRLGHPPPSQCMGVCEPIRTRTHHGAPKGAGGKY